MSCRDNLRDTTAAALARAVWERAGRPLRSAPGRVEAAPAIAAPSAARAAPIRSFTHCTRVARARERAHGARERGTARVGGRGRERRSRRSQRTARAQRRGQHGEGRACAPLPVREGRRLPGPVIPRRPCPGVRLPPFLHGRPLRLCANEHVQAHNLVFPPLSGRQQRRLSPAPGPAD